MDITNGIGNGTSIDQSAGPFSELTAAVVNTNTIDSSQQSGSLYPPAPGFGFPPYCGPYQPPTECAPPPCYAPPAPCYDQPKPKDCDEKPKACESKPKECRDDSYHGKSEDHDKSCDDKKYDKHDHN